MANKVFIIGNGFDVDLGFRTKYSDYYGIWHLNGYWPFENANFGLGKYLNDKVANKKVTRENWLDLEMALFEYAAADNGVASRLEDGNYPVDSDRDDFNLLKENLSQYLNRIPWETKPNDNSVAKTVLHYILDRKDYNIYSFNYTDLKKFSARLFDNATIYDGKEVEIDYTQVHGSLKNNDIVLGVHSDAELIEGYDFLRKIDQPSFNPENLLSDLNKAEEVVIFGLSIGLIDFPYFRNFFKKWSSDVIDSAKKIRISIFTYNDISEQQINKNLRELTKTDLLLLKTNTIFEVFHTVDNGKSDNKRLQTWLLRE